MTDDAELLRRYAEEHDESAFAELVRRHLGLVYHAALRQCGGDAHRAQDVAQSVFTDLARKAAQLARRPVLAGWLYTSTRYAAAQAVRGEVRRQAREREAQAMNEILSGADNDGGTEWERLRPVIDDVLHALGERDCEAILLRFFEGRAFADVGARLALTEDAARRRVERALEKMRVLLGRRGVTSTCGALAVALSSQVGAAVPAGLAGAIHGAALAGAATGGTAAAITFMSMTKIGIAGSVVVAAATGFWLQHRTHARLEAEFVALQQENAALSRVRTENVALNRARADLEARVGALQAEVATSKTQPEAAAPRVGVAKSSVGPTPGESASAVALAADLKPAANAGMMSSKAAAETIHWAINGGDSAAVAAAIAVTPAARARMQEAFARLSPEKQAQVGSAEQMFATLLSGTTQVAGLQVMSDQPGARGDGYAASLADDPSYHTVHLQRQYVDGRVREQDMVFQQTTTGWRWVVPDAVVSKLVVESGLPRPPNSRPGGG